MIYFVSIACHNGFPKVAFQNVEAKLYDLDFFSLGDLNGFICTEDFTEKGLFNYLVGDLRPQHLDQLVVSIFSKLPSTKSYPEDVLSWLKERKVKA